MANYIKLHGNQYLVAYIDDCSRYVLGAALLQNATTQNITDHLKTLLETGFLDRFSVIMERGTGHLMGNQNLTYFVKSMVLDTSWVE